MEYIERVEFVFEGVQSHCGAEPPGDIEPPGLLATVELERSRVITLMLSNRCSRNHLDRVDQSTPDREQHTPGPARGAQARRDGEKWTVILVRQLRHSPEEVWQSLTDPAHLREWARFEVDGSPAAATTVVARA
jgi:hypothetical protein